MAACAQALLRAGAPGDLRRPRGRRGRQGPDLAARPAAPDACAEPAAGRPRQPVPVGPHAAAQPEPIGHAAHRQRHPAAARAHGARARAPSCLRKKKPAQRGPGRFLPHGGRRKNIFPGWKWAWCWVHAQRARMLGSFCPLAPLSGRLDAGSLLADLLGPATLPLPQQCCMSVSVAFMLLCTQF